jgi:transposase
MNDQGTILERKKIPTNRSDLESFFRRYPHCKAVIESNTIWEFVFETLSHVGVEVILANPMQVKAIATARVKTDKVDSETLAHLLRTGMIPASYVAPEELRELRKDVRGRRKIKDLTTALKNEIYAELIRKGMEYKTGILGSKTGREQVSRLLPIPRVLRRLAILELLEKELKDYSQELLLPVYECSPKAQVLATIPGVGFYTALAVVSELGDVARFSDSDSIVSYAGLAPRVRQSATTLRMGPITKTGSSNLRWILVEAAHNHLNHCHEKEVCRLCKFHRRVSRRRGKNKAMVATAAKLLRIMYWMLKQDEPYRPQGQDLGFAQEGKPPRFE